MDSLVGRTISHFRFLDRIGEGGMGVVYRARDLQLQRDVAIKVLPPEAIANESARRRFRHEALTLSRLNHPHIETVFGFETLEGLDFLIVEFVAGRTLETRLRSGPLLEDEAVALAIMVADALGAAHERGVVHCDLKPSNIGLTPDGRVKVLDFGIAQVLRPRDAKTTLTLIESHPDGKRMVGGTLPYMAPEQLLGRKVDPRIDLYGLGVVLFEMVVGHAPFCEPLATAMVEDILHKPPPRPRTLNSRISFRLEQIILRCLEKDPASRYQTAADLRADLGRLKRDTELAIQGGVSVDRLAPTPKPPVPKAVLASVALIGVVAVVLIAVLRPHPIPIPAPPPPHRQVTFTGQAFRPAISPDGQYAAFIDVSVLNEQRLLVQDLTGGEPLRVFSARAFGHLRWSPDGSTILCRAVRDSDEAAFLVPKLGGTPRKVPAEPIPSWAPDSRRFVSASSTSRRLLYTDTATGDTSSIPLSGLSERIVDVDWSPRGDRIVVLATNDRGVYSFWDVIPGRGGMQEWFEDSSVVSSARWSPEGDAVYFLRQAGQEGLRDLCKIRWTGHPKPSSVRAEVLVHGLAAGDFFTVSRDGGRLLYTRETTRSSLWLVDLERHHGARGSGPKLLATGTSIDEGPVVSPDGKWVAFARVAGPHAEIFRIPMDGGEAQRMTFMNSRCRSPAWSPGGDTLAFLSDKGGIHRLWRVAARGGPARPYPGIEISNRPFTPLAWAPGPALLFAPRGDREYRLLDTRTGRTTSIGSADSMGWITYPQFSPDGTRIAWWCAGPRGLWVMTLASRVPVRLLRDGPVDPVSWTADGRWVWGIDYRAAKPRLARIPSNGGPGETRYELPIPGETSELGASPDGKRIVCSESSQLSDVWLVEEFDRHSK